MAVGGVGIRRDTSGVVVMRDGAWQSSLRSRGFNLGSWNGDDVDLGSDRSAKGCVDAAAAAAAAAGRWADVEEYGDGDGDCNGECVGADVGEAMM